MTGRAKEREEREGEGRGGEGEGVQSRKDQRADDFE